MASYRSFPPVGPYGKGARRGIVPYCRISVILRKI